MDIFAVLLAIFLVVTFWQFFQANALWVLLVLAIYFLVTRYPRGPRQL